MTLSPFPLAHWESGFLLLLARWHVAYLFISFIITSKNKMSNLGKGEKLEKS